jgi:hypothetical protein
MLWLGNRRPYNAARELQSQPTKVQACRGSARLGQNDCRSSESERVGARAIQIHLRDARLKSNPDAEIVRQSIKSVPIRRAGHPNARSLHEKSVATAVTEANSATQVPNSRAC